MKHFMSSFYAKLSALFLVLIVVLGGAIASLSVRSSMRFANEAEQKLSRPLAANVADEFQPFLMDRIDEERIVERIQYMTQINPRIEIYLLDSDGHIKASFVGPNQDIRRVAVNNEPLHRFLQGDALPILGDDPLHTDQQKPFSVAPIEIMGEEGYLYVILGSEQYDSAASMIKNSYIIQTSLRGFGLILLLTGLIGMVLFGLLTKRLRGMKDVVSAFEQGELDQRIDTRSSDEIGQLARSFNQMADTIVANMEELKRTDQLRRELIANVSHDLRSPLSSVQGYLETILMKSDTLNAKERQEYTEVALKNTQRLNKLVGELFHLSKLDAHQIQPEYESFAIAELVQDVVMQFTPEAEKAGVTLKAELSEGLPPVYADIALVERAISNLIDNALRYTPEGGTVRIVPARSGDAVTVRVIDTGQGIPEDELPHIFERFYRVEKSRDREEGGTGLGLAIARKILELHGSTIAVQSTVNQGTTFSFDLPTRANQRLQPA